MLKCVSNCRPCYPQPMASATSQKKSSPQTFAITSAKHAPAHEPRTEVQTQLGVIALRFRALPEELPRWINYPWADMVPGQCFDLPYRRKLPQRVRMAAQMWCRRRGLPMLFRVLFVTEGGRNLVRCWRLGTPLATQEPTEPETLDGPVNL